ncbi:hypothetical protein IFM89_012880 [Coptis chinensis]|uniref:Uncharacterized protein n=1 Tax=Coptis chinensis TaxID=261450 RepID=A0A835LRB2_9MAGN|nr:hypothetical protein IFM89_012880 [Coptis chinensis]
MMGWQWVEKGKAKDIKYIYDKSEEFVAGDWLQNEQKVVDYDIKNGFNHRVFRIQDSTKIHVKMLQIGKPITLDVDMRDTSLLSSVGYRTRRVSLLANKSFST